MTIRQSGVITGVSVSHRDANVDEVSAAGAESQRSEVTGLLSRSSVEEAFALQTCNRAEAYVVTADPAEGKAALRDFAPSVREEAIVRMDHEECLRHLMRVAAGLESMVLGEDQILGQVRTAYESARGVGGIGPTLEEAVTKAIHVGERVRSETALNEGVVSLGSAAAEIAADELELEASTALVVGAGEMGTLAARALDDRGVEDLVIANRTIPHAEYVAEDVETDASAISLSELPKIVDETDLVVATSASDDPLLGCEILDDAGETTLIDLAQPRDVAPAVDEFPHTTVYDLDALEAVTERTRRQRREAAREVEEIVDAELEHLLERFKRKRADEVIAAMYEGADEIKRRELSRALSQLEADGELTDGQRQAVEAMADALVNKLLAAPTKSLRDAAAEDDWTTIHTALQLFDPDFGGRSAVDPSELEDGTPASIEDG